MGWEKEVGFRREGTYVYVWLIHVVVWQKPTQRSKAILFQLKINFKKIFKITEEGLMYINR